MLKIVLNNDQVLELSEKENTFAYTLGNGTSQADLLIDIYNQRLRVLEIRGSNLDFLLNEIFNIAKINNLGKIWVVGKKEQWIDLLNWGYTLEGILPKFHGNDNAYYLSYYPDAKRGQSEKMEEEDGLIRNLHKIKALREIPSLPEGYQMRMAEAQDAQGLASFYNKIFPTYPTPMNDSQYVKKMMENKVIFYIIFFQEKIVAAASADIDEPSKSVEMTDIACDPLHRGKKLPVILVAALEGLMEQMGMITLYSLARATSPGINKTFISLDYKYYGRLIKNCDICGDFEDMNILAKTFK